MPDDTTIKTADDTALTLVTEAIKQAPMAALIFRPDENLTLVWRNRAHEEMSQSVGVDVVGQGMFEAFPPNETGDGAEARAAIHNAVASIVDTGDFVDIGPYRYDLKSPDGAFREYYWRIRMSPVYNDGRVCAVLQVAQDVTREMLDKKLSESLQATAVKTAAVSYFRYDPDTDVFVRTAAIDEMFGFEEGEVGQFAAPFFERIHPDDLPGVHAEVERVFAAPEGEVAAFDYRVPQDDGSERFLRIRAVVNIDPLDRRRKLVGSFVDLTDLETNRQRLERELSLREALVREANHRIKNSLAIALAMLRMERRAISKSGGDDASSALDSLTALESRINAISGAHGLMQLSGHKTDVSLRSLLDQLVVQTRSSVGLGDADIRLQYHGDETSLDSDSATSLAMILNELLTNALKYGLSKDKTADIEIVSETVADKVSITVRNRIESQQPIETVKSSKLGSTLVEQLARDFGSKVTVMRDGEFHTVRVDVPVSAK